MIRVYPGYMPHIGFQVQIRPIAISKSSIQTFLNIKTFILFINPSVSSSMKPQVYHTNRRALLILTGLPLLLSSLESNSLKSPNITQGKLCNKATLERLPYNNLRSTNLRLA